MEIRVVPYDPAAGDVLLWPDAVDAYWADQACTIRSSSGYVRDHAVTTGAVDQLASAGLPPVTSVFRRDGI